MNDLVAHLICIQEGIYLLKTGSLDNAIQDFLLAQALYYMSQ